MQRDRHATVSGAAVADTPENLVSSLRLADAQGFPAALAWVSSALAVLKFGAFTVADAALVVGLVAGIGVRWSHRRRTA